MYDTLEGDGRPILFDHCLYAAGYHKVMALMHACTADPARPPTHIFFIDDAPNNAYEVHHSLADRLRQLQQGGGNKEPDALEPVVRSLWWDLYEEEFETKTITPTTKGADFAYLRGGTEGELIYEPALHHFGLSRADIAARTQAFERVQNERDQRQAAKAAVESSDTRADPPAGTTPQLSVVERRDQMNALILAAGDGRIRMDGWKERDP